MGWVEDCEEWLETLPQDVADAIRCIAMRAGSFDADISVLEEAGKMIAELRRKRDEARFELVSVAGRERAIMRQVISDALEAGYMLSVRDDDDAECNLALSRDADEIMDNLLEWLSGARLIYSRAGHDDPVGWVTFVFGNDEDVISDYATAIGSTLTNALALSERLERSKDEI